MTSEELFRASLLNVLENSLKDYLRDYAKKATSESKAQFVTDLKAAVDLYLS